MVSITPDSIAQYSKAKVLPRSQDRYGNFSGGIFTSENELVKNSLYYKINAVVKYKNNQISVPQKIEKNFKLTMGAGSPQLELFEKRKGTYIYAGILFDHYGHFILDSLSRYWYYRNSDLPIVWAVEEGKQSLSIYQKEILDLLCINNEIILVDKPMEFEKLIVPEYGYIVQDYFSNEQSKALEIIDCPKVDFKKKIWLSRTSQTSARVLNENVIESHLEENGWIIYKPEDHSVRDQIEMYRDACHIAGIASSSQHTMVFLKGFKGKLTIFPRGVSLSGNYLTIQKRKRFKQAVKFISSFDCILPGETRVRCNRVFTNIEVMLNQLGVGLNSQKKIPSIHKNNLIAIDGIVKGKYAKKVLEIGADTISYLPRRSGIRGISVSENRNFSSSETSLHKYFDICPSHYFTYLSNQTDYDIFIIHLNSDAAKNKKIYNATLSASHKNSIWIYACDTTTNDSVELFFKYLFSEHINKRIYNLMGTGLYIVKHELQHNVSDEVIDMNLSSWIQDIAVSGVLNKL
ncbi:glycosyltransferase family 61 protein [Temperatibacter marinus]|uniref:Glycosyltransferase family 61 protein n=1 Tax=Temperatibacter marinus TaxID=1456591 RepID=A0AA52HA34_9PROT|nr:glycosyltransferase family 61 protein [Temperatibacter marinus]WND03202.1 glycosyltransferase family 61 protein [Temperatibacter marinus]